MIYTNCAICGEVEDPDISDEDYEEAMSISDTYTYLADEEGPGVLSDFDLDFICGHICIKCALKHYRSKE